jgi:hypothetical protein
MFIAEYGCAAYDKGGKALRLAYWNADGVHGGKLELEHFFIERGVDICLLNETHLYRIRP